MAQGNQPPRFDDREAELAVIGCALISGRTQPIDPVVFTVPEHRDIWRRMLEVERQGRPIDHLTVTEGKPPSWGSTLTQAAVVVPSTLHAEAYASRLRDLSARRQFVRAAEAGVKDLYSSESDFDEVLGRHLSRLQGIEHGEVEGARSLDVDGVVDDMLNALADPQEVWGLRSGWPEFDVEMGGLHRGETVLVAGTPGAGKSIFTTQTCAQMAGLRFWGEQQLGEPQPGVIFSLEMTEKATIRRLACGIARVSFRKLMRGKLDGGERDRFMEAIERIQRAPILISDSTEWTTDRMMVEVVGLLREHGIRWVLVDYAGKLRDAGDNEISRERRISQGLANIAKMGVAMIVVEQLNKEGTIYGSVQKQYDADVIVKIYDHKTFEPGQRRLRLQKAREADIALRFDVMLAGEQKRFDRFEPKQDREPKTVPHQEAEEIPF